jgi:hypothetical protein
MNRLTPLFACTLAITVFGASRAWAEATEFRLSKDGIGPISITLDIDIEGRNAILNASARNDTGLPITSARFYSPRVTRKAVISNCGRPRHGNQVKV